MSEAVNIAKSIVTRIPEHWEGKDALAYAGIGAVGGAGLGFLINNIKNRKQKRWLLPFLLGTGGALGGVGLYTGKQNFMQLTGGLTLGGQNQLPQVSKDLNGPGKHYTVYIGGMSNKPRYAQKLLPEANLALFNWGEGGKAVKFIDSLRPQDKVTVIGHSAGGGTALDVSKNTKHPILRTITLDPVVLNPLKRIGYLFRKLKNYNTGKIQNYIPQNYELKDPSNNYMKSNPFLLRKLKNVANIVVPSQSHSLWSTGYRATPQRLQTLKEVYQKINGQLSKNSALTC